MYLQQRKKWAIATKFKNVKLNKGRMWLTFDCWCHWPTSSMSICYIIINTTLLIYVVLVIELIIFNCDPLDASDTVSLSAFARSCITINYLSAAQRICVEIFPSYIIGGALFSLFKTEPTITFNWIDYNAHNTNVRQTESTHSDTIWLCSYCISWGLVASIN